MEAKEKGTDCMTLFKGSRLGKHKEVLEMKKVWEWRRKHWLNGRATIRL